MNPAQLLAHFDRISDVPDSIPRLRQFVLDLAVRGKLVEQDPREEPASELLKRIDQEKALFVKSGESKVLESFDPVGSDEIPFPIPSGWAVTRMGWLARKLGAGSTPLGEKSVYQNEGVPFLRSQNVHNDGLRLDDVALISRAIHDRMSGTHVQQQDILLNITGASIGRCALVPITFVEGNVSQHVAIIRLFLPAIRQFIHLSLTSPFFQKVIDDVQVGVSREGLSMQRLRLFPMLLPPLAEQHRIVTKVDELMALCDRLEATQAERERRRDRLAAASLHRLNQPADRDTPEVFREHARFYLIHLPRLTTHPDQIKHLRQTILNLAIRGQLVPQDPSDESGSALLARIQKSTHRSKRSQSTSQLSSKAETPSVRFPDSWISVQIGEVTESIVPQRDKPLTFTGEIPWVTLPNFREGSLRLHFTCPRLGLSPSEVQQYRLRVVPAGSVLMSCIGRFGLTALTSEDCIPNQQIHAFCFDPKDLNGRYLCYTIMAQKQYLESESTTTTISYLNKARCESMPVSLPPLAEQHRIVARVDELMSLCDQLETQLTTARTESRRLLEAVLHEAITPAALHTL